MTGRLSTSRRFGRALAAMLADYYHDFGTQATLRARGYRMPRESLARALALLADEDPVAFLALREYYGSQNFGRTTSRMAIPPNAIGALDKLARRLL